MVEYPKELMVAIVAAATVFIGLTPVLVGQVSKSGLKRCSKGVLYRLLGISVVCGMLAVLLALILFSGQRPAPDGQALRLWSIALFGVEIIICEAVMLAICFWFGPIGELEPGKPATPPTRFRR